jgi:ribonuclease-3
MSDNKSEAKKDVTKELQKVIRIKFHNQQLLNEALTHKSYAVETVPPRRDNERLEFLGDSLLSAIVSSYLYKTRPQDDEGLLSQQKAQLISRKTLYNWAKEINLGQYICLSRGEETTGGRERESILANAFEALLGAIYLDRGYPTLEKFILQRLKQKKFVQRRDYKSQLQEIIQGKHKLVPAYRVIKETGPEHNKTFEIGVYFKKKILGRGTGKSKKEAEQEAAKNALEKLEVRS